MIRKRHQNRKAHNWLAYRVGDKFRKNYTPLYKGKLYDLGCGTAPYRDYFLQYASDYIGVDWKEKSKNKKVDVVADLNKPLPVESSVADSVVSFSVLEHLCEPQTMLNEAYRILKPGGNIILQVPWQWWVHEAPYDYFRYTPYGLKYMFEKAGFIDINIEAQGGFFIMWILKMNYFSKRFVRGPKILRFPIKVFITPVWFIAQLIAPLLDKLDFKKTLETRGYYVAARKQQLS